MKSIESLHLKNKKYIIFDMDGTLIDSIGVWNRVDQKLIEEFGNRNVDLNKIQMDRDRFLQENQTGDIYLLYCEYLINKYHLNICNTQQFLRLRWKKSSEILENEMDFKPNAVSLLLKLKELGFVLVLATMTSQIQIDIYSKKNKKMMTQMNIEEVFDLIIKKEDVKTKKPSPEIYNKIMEYYGACASECLVFEDSYTGVLACKNAGIECINIYDKYADIERNKINQITDYSIHDYSEIIPIIEKQYPEPYKKYLREDKIYLKV